MTSYLFTGKPKLSSSSGKLAASGSLLSLLLVLSSCGGAAAPGSSPAAPSSTAGSSSAKPAAPSSSAASSAAASASGSAAAKTSGAIPQIPAGTTVSITTATGVPSAVFTPVWIALDKGYFAKHGLKVTLQQIEGVTQAQAIIAGEVQIGNVGGAEVLDSRVGGAQIVALAEGTASPVFEIHAPPSIKKVEDLRGKTVATTRAGSSTDMATRVILQKHGLTPDKDVKLLATGNMPSILATLVNGAAQAGTMSPPTTSKANDAGFPKLASALDEHVPLHQNLLVTMKPYADAHPEVVYAYLEGYMEGLRDFFNSPDAAVAAIAKYTKSDQKAAQEAYKDMRPALDAVPFVQEAGFKTVQELGANTKTRTLNVAQAHDDTFLQRLKDSGFIDQLGIKK